MTLIDQSVSKLKQKFHLFTGLLGFFLFYFNKNAKLLEKSNNHLRKAWQGKNFIIPLKADGLHTFVKHSRVKYILKN